MTRARQPRESVGAGRFPPVGEANAKNDRLERSGGPWAYRLALLAFIVGLAFLVSGQGGAFGITFAVGVVGFILIRAMESSGQARAPRGSDSAAPSRELAELEKLGELRDKGVLTEDEFRQRKADLLGTRQSGA